MSKSLVRTGTARQRKSLEPGIASRGGLANPDLLAADAPGSEVLLRSIEQEIANLGAKLANRTYANRRGPLHRLGRWLYFCGWRG